MVTEMTTSDERGEMFMWESSAHLTLHKMRDFLMRSVAQPKLQVLIPKRTISVPHHRSKRFHQLQSKPRDPNASPHLLMVAPPSDCRYRLMAGPQGAYKEVPSNGERLRHPVTHLNNSHTPQNHHGNVWQDSLNFVPGPEYIHQISTIAAMAWSDCSQATEKLRRIYEQTALFSQNPMVNPCAPPSIQTHEFSNKLKSFPPIQPQEMFKFDQKPAKSFYDERNWELPSVYCACAVCQMTKRAKSSLNSQRSKGEVSKHAQQQAYIKQQSLVDRQAIAAGLASGNTGRRHHNNNKRTHSPEENKYQMPRRKTAKHEHVTVAKQHSRPATGHSFLNQALHGGGGQLLSCVGTGAQHPLPDDTSYLTQNLIMSGFQNPATGSTYMTSSGDVVTPRELMVTPSFESQFFGAGQNPGGILNNFSSFLPPRILNALE